VVVVQRHISQQRLLQVLSALEAVASHHISNAAVEAVDHPVGARGSGLGQPVLDAQAGTPLTEPMLLCGLPGARCKEPVGKPLGVTFEDALNVHWAHLVRSDEKHLGAGGDLNFLDLREHRF
jgi:hypothetical protein